MTPLLFERIWPYIGSVLLTLCWFRYLNHPFPSPTDDLMLATGTTSAVLIGFLATAKAIVLGLTNSPVFQAIKETGYHRILFTYFFEAVVVGTLLLVFSVSGFFLAEHQSHLWFATLWMVLATSAILTYLRVVSVLFKLIDKS